MTLRMGSSNLATDFSPLLKALRQIESRLNIRDETHILVATGEKETFQRQVLASHNRVIERKLLGPRVPVRGRRRINQTRAIEAHWPSDKLHEVTTPCLNFVLNGQADMRIADYSVHCWPGDIILIPAGLPRSDGSAPDYVEVTPASTCDILLFSPGLVAGTGLECSIGHSRGEKHMLGTIDERCWVKNILIAQLYASLCEELEDSGNSRSTYYLLMLLLIHLQKEIESGNAMVGWPFSSVVKPDVEQELIRQALKYINDHLEEQLTIDIVARQIGVSRTIFTREFRRAIGDSFKNYLINQRMKRAEILLKEANLPVNRVSKEVGLSPGRLRGLFRQRHQRTPDEFRRS